MPSPSAMPPAADIRIIERVPGGSAEPPVVLPNEVWINGRPVLCPDDDAVVVHSIDLGAHDVVKVTLTLYARSVTIGAEPASGDFATVKAAHQAVAKAESDLADAHWICDAAAIAAAQVDLTAARTALEQLTKEPS